MKFEDIETKLNDCINIPFFELFEDDDLNDIIINKGKSGKLLEMLCEIENGNGNVDLDDMEIKSFKIGQTIAITQISSHFEDIMSSIKFTDSWLYEKIKTVLFIETDKSNLDPKQWLYKEYKIISLEGNIELFKKLEIEFNSICSDIRNDVNENKFISTTNGDGTNSYLQIRTKDSVPYHPIYYKGKQVSKTKNFAFYFRNKFIKEIIMR